MKFYLDLGKIQPFGLQEYEKHFNAPGTLPSTAVSI
jgi:hypothetical protein